MDNRIPIFLRERALALGLPEMPADDEPERDKDVFYKMQEIKTVYEVYRVARLDMAVDEIVSTLAADLWRRHYQEMGGSLNEEEDTLTEDEAWSLTKEWVDRKIEAQPALSDTSTGTTVW